MFSVKSAARELGISASLVYALIASKKIRHERFGLGRGTIRIPVEAIEEYRVEQTVAVTIPNNAPRIPRSTPRYRHLKLS